jgi:hypothetical protein
MRTLRLVASLTLCAGLSLTSAMVAGCANPLHKKHDDAAVAVTQHDYKGTASVGDFITIHLDTAAQTISYTNITNGLSGSGTFTVNLDGSYAITESSGCFTEAFEIPGYALVLKGLKTGPTQDTVSLVTSIDSQVNTVAGVSNQSYNYMQFRTNSGGLEVGHVGMGAAAQVTHAGYWPYGAHSSTPSDAFMPASTFPGSPVEDAATGALKLTITDTNGTSDNYIFATTSGLLAVDTGNGSLICLKEAAASTFQTADAGTYRAFSYGKLGASTGMGNVESPAAGTVDKVTITVGSDGSLLIRDGANATLASGTLQPFAGSALETGIGFACPGLFHATIGAQEVFVTFTGDAMLFSSFTFNSGSGTYDYFYGVGLKQVAGNG